MEWINRQNPWWYSEDWENEDKHLKDWRAQEIRWVPSWINEISLKPFSLNFIYGLRQLGKTTGIKLIMKRIMEKVDTPFSLFYFDFEIVGSEKEMLKILERYIEIRTKERVDISYMFLDEVSSVDGWWKVIKFLIDRGMFENDVITVSGSSTVNLVKIPERFPGRRGNGKNVVVLPLSFPEFIEIQGDDPKKMVYSDKIRDYWEMYKKTGGFPKAINRHEDAMETFISAFISEIHKGGKSPKKAWEILSSILRKIPSAMSYNAVGSDIGISHVTVREYMEFMEDCLLMKSVYNKAGGRVSFRREKKIFFRDPFIYRAFSFWTGEKFLEGALYEGIVQEHMFRKFEEVYYHRNRYEIDCVAGDMKVEVKAGKPHRRYPRNVKILDEDDLPLFLVEMMEET